MKQFQIFRSGTHVASSGASVTLSEADLAASAAAYDPALHEAPIVIGHPKDDAPAYGWVASLVADGENLMAVPNQVDAAFSEMVSGGRFKKRSASFYLKGVPGNPNPDVFYLRHCAFLGAAAPAVKGMKPVEFAGGASEFMTVEFGEEENLRSMSWAMSSIGRLAQAFREFLVSERGEEEADKAIDTWAVEDLFKTAGRLMEQANNADTNDPAFSEHDGRDTPVPKTPEQLAAEATQLTADQDALKQQQADFSERTKKTDRADNARELQVLIDAGTLAPGIKQEALDFMAQLDGATTAEFGEGDGVVKVTPREWFLGLLKKSGTLVDFSEQSAEEGDGPLTADFAAPTGSTVDAERLALHNKALAYQTAHPNTTYDAALSAVGVR